MNNHLFGMSPSILAPEQHLVTVAYVVIFGTIRIILNAGNADDFIRISINQTLKVV